MLFFFNFYSLQDRQLRRNVCRNGQRPTYSEIDEILVPVFRKLHSQGITEDDEDKLLYLKDIMLKLHRAKARFVEQYSLEKITSDAYIYPFNHLLIHQVICICQSCSYFLLYSFVSFSIDKLNTLSQLCC